MRIVLSFNRAAQLDLLLQSLDRNAEPENTVVLARASTPAHDEGYDRLVRLWPNQRFIFGDAHSFVSDRQMVLDGTTDEFVTFFCDDDVLFRPIRTPRHFEQDVLCFSLRLGANCTRCYPTGEEGQPFLYPRHDRLVWEWLLAPGDFGYAGSHEGHTFRTNDLRKLFDDRTFTNPTEVEDAFQAGCLDLAYERPLMVCHAWSSLCSIPVNRVSEQSQVRYGERYPQSAEELNDRFVVGERIDLDAFDFSQVNAAHYEFPFVWKPA